MELSKEDVILEPKSFAYYYLITIYKNRKKVEFYEHEFFDFLQDFVVSMTAIGCATRDENGNKIEIDNEHFYKFGNAILDSYASRNYDVLNKMYFLPDCIDEIQNAYQNMSKSFKNSIISYEMLHSYNSYFTKEIYTVYANSYKKIATELEENNDNEKILA